MEQSTVLGGRRNISQILTVFGQRKFTSIAPVCGMIEMNCSQMLLWQDAKASTVGVNLSSV